MKVIALTYSYDLPKLMDIGRKWAPDVYGGKDFIFEYSAASYATFLDKHRNQTLYLYTDDIVLLKSKMEKYNVPQNIEYVDFSETLNKIKNSKYGFDALTEFIYAGKSSDDFTVKIDNDLVFNGQLPEPQPNSVFVWKYERLVREGDPKMGEIKVVNETVKELDLPIYNLGVLGIPHDFPESELRKVCAEMVNVDISDVSDLGAKIWHCCEQTANNWVFKNNGYNIIQTHNIVDHLYDNKKACIEKAKHLLK
jgi:hypothetical protein